ncbi:dephospho-CoA kinase [Lentilactobacillus kribbianus]|uniref:dephospho-CoA kinase n=1 Tax=Lentilactobacillus kribbianus TaxID=2729622 RepID=UPI001553AA7C|nr:dephospho-CoA kinase [Lentilactobacillus kribbianus]
MSKIVGLTGGIATGKSLVSKYLTTQGIPVIDADQVTREVQARGTAGLAAITAVFGPTILTENGDLNRQQLGELVFNDSTQLKLLVRTIDPFIRAEITNQIKNYQDKQLVILDAPMLFEQGYQTMVDQIMVVYCNPEQQLRRLCQRNQLSIGEATKRIASQWPLSVKQSLADEIINNSGSIKQTQVQVALWLAAQQ